MIRLSFIVFVTSTLLSVGQTKYRFERASRVVEIKHGRIQGNLVELPIVPTSTGLPAGSSDGDISFEDDAHEPQVSSFYLSMGVSTVGSNRGIINSSLKSPKVSINLYPDWEIKAYTMQSRQGFWTCEEISLKPVKTRTLDQEHLETNQDPQACF